MKKRIYFFVIAGLAFAGCKKEDPKTPAATTPVFSFNGTVNGTNVSLAAGVNQYYMFTSYALDTNSIYNFIGELRDYNCTANCKNSLRITIRDYRPSYPNATSVDTSLMAGYYSFASPLGTPSQYYVHFSDSVENGGTSIAYHWDFGDGGTSNLPNPSHVYHHPGIYKVSLQIQSNGGSCSSSLVNDVAVGQVGNPIQLGFAGSASGNTIQFNATVGGGVSPYSYLWDFGDGMSSTGTVPTHVYANSGVYAVRLDITDAVNNTQSYHVNVPTDNCTSCVANFYPDQMYPMPNYQNYAGVTVEWRDANGTVYTSNSNNQSVKSLFKILSVDDYQNNTSGQATKKIHAHITCTLYYGSISIPFDGDVVFSVAHP